MMAAIAYAPPPAPESLAFGVKVRLKQPMLLNNPQKNLPLAANAPNGLGAVHAGLLQKVGAAQDEAAFAELFHYFAPRVKSYMLKQGASESAAEEIVQNAFVTIWEKAASYNPAKSAASTWIFTIARNKRIDALRKEKYVEINTDEEAYTNTAAPEAEKPYADSDDVTQLTDAIADLPPEQAELVRMAFFDEKSHVAIAEEKHLPLGTVKSRLRLAMDKLRAAMVAHSRKNDGGEA